MNRNTNTAATTQQRTKGVAEGVLRLPGESLGADLEVARAEEQGVPVFKSIADLVDRFAAVGSANAHDTI